MKYTENESDNQNPDKKVHEGINGLFYILCPNTAYEFVSREDALRENSTKPFDHPWPEGVYRKIRSIDFFNLNCLTKPLSEENKVSDSSPDDILIGLTDVLNLAKKAKKAAKDHDPAEELPKLDQNEHSANFGIETILARMLSQIKVVDFRKELGIADDDLKIKQADTIVVVIIQILKLAEQNN